MPTKAPVLRQDVRAARDDLASFATLVGYPMAHWQVAGMQSSARQTILISPRQCGKSRSLALLAVWTAFRRPGTLVMIVSASETAATRLLFTVREICQHPLLSGSTVDETMTRLVLSNGSRVLSVPASEKSIRGWSVDLLVVDEAAFISEDILFGAAFPTTAARPHARIILASSPWGDQGPFYALAQQGLDPNNPHVDTHRWKLNDAHWISEAVVEAARATLSPLRFRAEYEGEFVTSGDAYFDQGDILACIADYPLTRIPGTRTASQFVRPPAVAGLDWGRRQDAHAVAIAGVLDDYGVNPEPIVIVPWLETSRRPYVEQVDEVIALTGYWDLAVRAETNGVGQMPVEELVRKLDGRVRITPSSTTMTSKEDAYGRLRLLLASRRIVLPQHTELLRQLGGITATATPTGGLRIAARVEHMHDDIPDALTLAITGLPTDMASPIRRDYAEDIEWVTTPDGVQVPLPVNLIRAELDWGMAYAPSAFAPRPAEEEPNPWDEVYGGGGAAQNPAAALQRLAAMREHGPTPMTPMPR